MRICELPEYYQTRTEMALLTRHAPEIAALMGRDVEILEYGAGSLRKVRILLDAAQSPYAYTPLDISGDYLQEVVRALAVDYPALVLRPVVGDFTGPLEIPDLPGRNARTSRARRFLPRQHNRKFQARCRHGLAAPDARQPERRWAVDRGGFGQGPGTPACRL